MELSGDKDFADSICESCGEKFLCGVETGKCWCFEVDLEEKTLEEIKKDFKKCLCQNCLIAYNKKQNVFE